MANIARGQENTPDRLNWFISVNCQTTDAYEVGFQIWDVTAGQPGSQVFPATPGDWEDVTNAPGKFSVGSYYAYDNANAQGWTPSIAEPLGPHLIKWRWKITAASPYQASQQEFDVLVESAGGSADFYCTVQDIRDEGVTVAQADDDKVLDYIETFEQFIDRACRQWFKPKTLTFSWDGDDTDTAFFGVPIISISSLKINDSSSDLDTSDYRVYSEAGHPDDRFNPRIKLYYGGRDLFAGYRGRRQFLRGRQNQQVTGIFGFVESCNQQTPKLIRRALIKLVVDKLLTPINPTQSMPTPPAMGPVVEEWTDGHKLKYASSSGVASSRRPGLSGITSDQEVLDILKLYRGPIGIATPADWRV